MRSLWISVCVAGLGVIDAGAQVSPKAPARYAGTERAPRVVARPPGMRLGRKAREFALGPLSESEVEQLAAPDKRMKAGIRRVLPESSMATGGWEVTAEGARIWRMALRSPASRGMRVEFDRFSVGAGKAWLYDGTNVDGPYTGDGIYGDRHFWSGAITSGSVTVEYEPAPGAGAELQPPFVIRAISHQTRTALDALESSKDPADYCELDANCYPDWKNSLSSVGQISFMDQGYDILCSGSLLATRDNSFKPYFLTAGHCINNEAAARTVQAYWNYQTDSCGAAAPTSRGTLKSAVGSHLLYSTGFSEGDFSLILLQDVPAGTTFAGWDTADPPVSSSLTGIHHPSGSWKRISFGERVADATNEVEGQSAAGENFLQVEWAKGRVERGSSGSPLFSSPGVVVGSLSYGPVLGDGTVCSIIPSVAGYSRFSNIYSQVKDYLENLPADLITPARPSVSFSMANRTAPAAQSVQLVTQATGNVTYKLRADANWIKLSSIAGVVSAKTPASVAVSIDSAMLSLPGDYAGTVTIFSGAADPQFLRVTASVRIDQSNVTASIAPNPVVQSGNEWSFSIRLAETAGAATRLTALKFNGSDYSSSISTWFGGSRIPASGAIVAPLRGAGTFPRGDQYFEFWGVDEASGQAWYRVASVTFQ